MTERVVSFLPADAAAGRSRRRATGTIRSFLIGFVVYHNPKQERAPFGALSNWCQTPNRCQTPERGLRDHADVRRLRALSTFGRLELDLCAFGKALEAFAGDARVMHEQVLCAVLRGDEAVPLLVAEPLDGSGCHIELTSLL